MVPSSAYSFIGSGQEIGHDETDLVPIAIGNPMILCLLPYFVAVPMVRTITLGLQVMSVLLVLFRTNSELEYRYKKGAQNVCHGRA